MGTYSRRIKSNLGSGKFPQEERISAELKRREPGKEHSKSWRACVRSRRQEGPVGWKNRGFQND